MPSDLWPVKPLMERYLQATPAKLAPFSFVNIFVWQDFFQFDFEEIDGNLCVFASDQAGAFLYLPPLGKTISAVAVKRCFERLHDLNKGSGVTRIENAGEEQLSYFLSNDFKIYKKGYELLYYRKDLVELKGDAYKSKRHANNYFSKNFSAVYRPYEKTMAGPCRELFENWDRAKRLTLKEDAALAMLDDNKFVHRRALEYFEELGLVGRVVEVDGKIAAYTFGYFIRKDTFCDFLEIADKKYQGLAASIFNQLCADPVLREASFINVMDDFSMESVSQTKMSYRPSLLLSAYIINPVR